MALCRKLSEKTKYIISTSDPSSIYLVVSSKKQNIFVKHDLAFRNPCLDVFNNLCLIRKSTMWSLINLSNNSQITDVKLTGL